MNSRGRRIARRAELRARAVLMAQLRAGAPAPKSVLALCEPFWAAWRELVLDNALMVEAVTIDDRALTWVVSPWERSFWGAFTRTTPWPTGTMGATLRVSLRRCHGMLPFKVSIRAFFLDGQRRETTTQGFAIAPTQGAAFDITASIPEPDVFYAWQGDLALRYQLSAEEQQRLFYRYIELRGVRRKCPQNPEILRKLLAEEEARVASTSAPEGKGLS